MAAYCLVRGIDYIVDECPMAIGNKHLEYKTVLNDMEVASPGSKHEFYFGYLDRLQPAIKAAEIKASPDAATEKADLTPCIGCGSPSSNEICAFCALVNRTAGTHVESTLVASPKRRSKTLPRSNANASSNPVS